MNNDFEMGCGTGIKWNFDGAKYPKKTALINNDGINGEITLCYHFAEGSKHTYFVKWDNGLETEIKEEDIEKYLKK